MQFYASCLLPSLLGCCSCLLFFCRSLLVLQLFHCVSLSAFLAFYSIFYTVQISQCMLGHLVCAVYAGKACLSFQTCDWSQLHAGIACLAFLAYDWATTCLHSFSMLLHAGIVCLASWPLIGWLHTGIARLHLACWDSMSSFLGLWLGNCIWG